MNKKFWTSNYARQCENVLAYATSVKAPDWYTGKTLPILAPTWELVADSRSGYITTEEYEEAYIALVHERNAQGEVINAINGLPNGSFLLCYEAPKDFCHRHSLGRWITQYTRHSVCEWMTEKEIIEEERKISLDSFLDF